jgi:hypothetical protein
MGLRTSAGDAAWNARERAWSAEDRVAEVAFGLERRVVWPVRTAAEDAGRSTVAAMAPLQRLAQTKLAWPVADAYRRRGVAARAAIATAAVVAAIGAGSAGVVAGTEGEQTSGGGGQLARSAGAAAPAKPNSEAATLLGIAPDFEQGHNPEAPAAPATAAPAAKTGLAATTAAAPGAPVVASAAPDEVALLFADAFVHYEVGEVDDRTAATFEAVAADPLAKALAKEPPRLPASEDVPRARVLNVVLGEREGEQVEASVSLVRLRAASELRLTLRHTPEGWQVAEVLG